MKKIVHTTKVRLDQAVLKQVADEALEAFKVVDSRETTEGRSLFSTWNTLKSHVNDPEIVSVEGSCEPRVCERVYYKPSYTSMPKEGRKAIKPLNDGNVFVFFDLKSAEFFLTCLFANEETVIRAYNAGYDPYDALSYIFPAGTPRDVYKTTLIASLYGVTDWTLAKQLGCSEAYASHLLAEIQHKMPALTAHKLRVIGKARRAGMYFCPTNFEQTKFLEFDYKPDKKTKQISFKPNLALSVYTQSALGCWMQSLIKNVQQFMDHSGYEGTLLTVFDSMLIECPTQLVPKLVTWLQSRIKPFRASQFTIGTTFYDAAYSNKSWTTISQ